MLPKYTKNNHNHIIQASFEKRKNYKSFSGSCQSRSDQVESLNHLEMQKSRASRVSGLRVLHRKSDHTKKYTILMIHSSRVQRYISQSPNIALKHEAVFQGTIACWRKVRKKKFRLFTLVIASDQNCAPLLCIISGAKYSGVPRSVQVRSSTFFAKPKSVILMCPWRSISRFSGFKSR